MLIKLQLDSSEPISEIDDYSQGHITIEGKNGIISSNKAEVIADLVGWVAQSKTQHD